MKKKFKAPELEALKSTLKESWIKQVGTIEGFEETWIVIEQAAKYSFNASHSLSYAYDSLYGAYLKSHYPMDYYTVVFNYYDGDMARTRTLTNELKHFGIQLKSPKFRKSLSGYSCDKEGKVIYKGLHSIKFLNSEVADGLYSLRDNQYRNFIDFLYDAREKVKVDYRQLSILIQLDFFEEFGDANSLLVQLGLFRDIHDKKQLRKDKLIKTVVMKKENVNGETVEKTFDVEIPTDIATEFCSKETEKQYSGVNMRMLLEKLCPAIEVPKATVKDKVNAQKEYLGYIDIMEDRYSGMAYVEDLNTKYTPRLELYSLKNGTILSCKISKPVFNKNKLEVGDVVLISSTDYKPKSRKLESGGYEEIPGTRELWITRYEKVAI